MSSEPILKRGTMAVRILREASAEPTRMETLRTRAAERRGTPATITPRRRLPRRHHPRQTRPPDPPETRPVRPHPRRRGRTGPPARRRGVRRVGGRPHRPSPSPSTGRRPEDRMNDLTARIDERLAATEGHTPALWVADYVGDNAYLISSVTPGTIDGNLRQIGLITHMPDDARMEDAALIASAPTLRALLVESAARIRDLEAQLAAQAEALAKAERELAQERSSHSDTVDQRDRAHDAADRLAYALFDIDEIGEHSSCNCPWANAAERLEDMATPQQVSQ